VGPTVDLFGFPAQINTVTAEKLQTCTASYIYRIRPLGSAGCVIYIYRIRPLKVNIKMGITETGCTQDKVVPG